MIEKKIQKHTRLFITCEMAPKLKPALLLFCHISYWLQNIVHTAVPWIINHCQLGATTCPSHNICEHHTCMYSGPLPLNFLEIFWGSFKCHITLLFWKFDNTHATPPLTLNHTLLCPVIYCYPTTVCSM